MLLSPGDAELAPVAAGLTVGKPDDRFSVADSAQGRSIAVTMTTAGVTEFTEVSQSCH